jgi:hypothetical protein
MNGLHPGGTLWGNFHHVMLSESELAASASVSVVSWAQIDFVEYANAMDPTSKAGAFCPIVALVKTNKTNDNGANEILDRL